MIEQALIAVASLTAMCLTQSASREMRRRACLFGLAGQPLWIHATYSHGMWGMTAINLVYAFVWGRSVWRLWIKKEEMI